MLLNFAVPCGGSRLGVTCGGGQNRLRGFHRRSSFAGKLDRRTSQSCRVKAAERLVEGHDVAEFGMVGEQRNHVAAIAEHVFGKTLQRFLGTGFNEDPGAGRVQSFQAFHKLHRRCNLLCQHLHHLRFRVRAGRIKLAIDVCNDRQPRRLQPQPHQHALQWFAGPGDNCGVKSVTHRQRHSVDAGLQENLQRLLDCLALTADDCLALTVDVGDHDVAVDGFQGLLDLLQRCENSRHPAIVSEGHVGHFAATGADRFHRVGKGQSSGGDQRSILAHTVAHRHVRLDAIGGQQPGHGYVGGDDGGLGNGRLAQVVLRLGDGGGVGSVNEDEFAERLAQQRRENLIRFRKSLGYDGFGGAQRLDHIHVL